MPNYCECLYDQKGSQNHAFIKCSLVKNLSSYCECVYDHECFQQHAFIKCSIWINHVRLLWMFVWLGMLGALCIHQIFPPNKPCQVIVNVCMIMNAPSTMHSSNVPSGYCVRLLCIRNPRLQHHVFITDVPSSLKNLSSWICMIRNALSTMHSSNVPSSKTRQVIVKVCMKSAMLSTPCTHQMFPPN